MSLRRLCFVLPMDVDDSVLAAQDSRRRRETTVTSYVCGTIGRVLSCLRCRWCCGARQQCHDSSLFQDIAGVVDDVGGRKLADAGSSPRIFSYSELYIGSNGFSDKEVLGSGGFGRVYRAVLPSDGTTVAVKCVASRGDRFEKSFLAELAAVARLRHRNLVRLRGWCVHDDEELLLVYEYMPNRSLDRLLFASKSSAVGVLSWDQRRRIVAGLAAALFYLHEQLDTQIIHRDVKTSNVMLDSEYNARLGDFGLARWLEHTTVCGEEDAAHHQQPTMEVSPSPPSARLSSSSSANYHHQFRLMDTSRIGGTIGYLPPESFQRRSTGGTAKSDVFSFGIVLLEVATGRRAVDLTYPDDQIFMLDWVRRLSDEGKLLNAADRKLPDALSDIGRLMHIGLLCALHDPRARPTMKWVVENLSDSTCSGHLPPLPSFLALPRYISLTSSSDSGTTTNTTDSTATSLSHKPLYATAAGDTIYLTAEDGTRCSSRCADDSAATTGTNNSHRSSSRPVVPPIPNVDTPREISYKEIVAITNDFSESQVVAEMDFGTGYQGFMENGHHGLVHVLVKRLGMKTCPALRVRFARELCNLAKLRHRNLVQLRGWCTEQGEMLVVYDYSPGSLLSHHLLIRRDQHAVLPWRQRYKIVKALASAVLYLHEEWDERVIHRNITSSAVFLDPDMNPRLGSFALAEFLSRNEHHGGGHHVVVESTSAARGIFGYMSPEYMETGEATTMADVYSFGVVMLEVVTGMMAVDPRLPEVLLVRKVQLYQEMNRPVVALADPRLDGRFDDRELARMVRLGIACTRSNPAARPSMRKIVSILDGNDEVLDKFEHRKESTEDWQRRNAASLRLVRRLKALGIH
ncbi:hypothetical protein QOZ80_9AG0682290 [Eleusine coracana subsp. coracana]|nr:hypothetical protein QOZ80_9AG0682290 [Eleusine coracana subsp. coracana]